VTTPPHPLDRPVWSALNSGWAGLSERAGTALRLDRDYGPFAAAEDGSTEGLSGLLPLITPGEETWLVEITPPTLPAPIVKLSEAACVQMIAPSIESRPPGFDIVPLSEPDAAEMRALALLTKPGPFRRKTHRLGRFVGVREQGRLIAMAGERMRLDGFVEVSGVCTHPDHRGRGYAGGLMRQVAARILAEGDTPFLHAYAANTGAIALYETLGFRVRTEIVLTEVKRAD